MKMKMMVICCYEDRDNQIWDDKERMMDGKEGKREEGR